MKHGCEALDAPDFEHYGEEFDARTGMGGAEIWVPVEKGSLSPLTDQHFVAESKTKT